MKTRKIFDCTYSGHHIIIEFHNRKRNPYRIFRKHYDNGWHKKQLEQYADFNSCLCFVVDYYTSHTDVFKD